MNFANKNTISSKDIDAIMTQKCLLLIKPDNCFEKRKKKYKSRYLNSAIIAKTKGKLLFVTYSDNKRDITGNEYFQRRK